MTIDESRLLKMELDTKTDLADALRIDNVRLREENARLRAALERIANKDCWNSVEKTAEVTWAPVVLRLENGKMTVISEDGLQQNWAPAQKFDATTLEWAEEFERTRRVAKTEINGCSVSTVRLPFGHLMPDDTMEGLFETMVFTDEQSEWHDYQERYRTVEEALAGHARVVARIASGGLP